MPTLLFPVALAVLLALIVPLAIHVARRSEQVPTDFAALRWLRQKPKPRSRLRFDEWLLLALRLALIAALALWLAGPVLLGGSDSRAYVAVVPGVDASAMHDAASGKDGAHWLIPGFPAIDPDAAPETLAVPVGSLVRELDADLPPGRPLTLVVPQQLAGADAERPRLSRKVVWRIVPGAMPVARVAASPVPMMSIRADAAHVGAARHVRAAAQAWAVAGARADVESAAIDAPLPSAARRLVWLGAGTLPDTLVRWIDAGGQALVASDTLVPPGMTVVPVWRDAAGRPLAEAAPMGKGRLTRFTRPLTPADMPVLMEAEFPARFRALLEKSPPAPQRVAAADYAPVTGGRSYPQAPDDLRPWLALLIAVLLVVERWVATRPSRAVNP